MSAVDLTSVPERVSELVEEASRDGEVVLTRGGEAVAKIVPLPHERRPRRAGTARGLIIHMSDDFDETPEELKEYF